MTLLFLLCEVVFCVSILLISALNLIISSLLLLLGDSASFFSRAFRCAVKFPMCDFSVFFNWALSAMNFPLCTAFIVSHRFEYVVSLFSLNSRKVLISFFISSLTQGWFSSWLFNFHEFVGFLGVALLLNSNFNPWWSYKTQVVTNIFLYLWKFALLPNMWSIFEKVPWAAEKKVYSFLFGWNVL